MKTVRLIHWNEDEGLERREPLEAFGFDAAFDFGDGVVGMRLIRASLLDAVVIDLTRMPSHGREVAHGVRSSTATRHVPIVFVGGEAEKVERTRQLLPDATYTTWGRIKTALPKAIAEAPKNPIVPDHNAAWGKPASEKLGAKRGQRRRTVPGGPCPGCTPGGAVVRPRLRLDLVRAHPGVADLAGHGIRVLARARGQPRSAPHRSCGRAPAADVQPGSRGARRGARDRCRGDLVCDAGERFDLEPGDSRARLRRQRSARRAVQRRIAELLQRDGNTAAGRPRHRRYRSQRRTTRHGRQRSLCEEVFQRPESGRQSVGSPYCSPRSDSTA